MLLVYPSVPGLCSLKDIMSDISLLSNMRWNVRLRVISTVSAALAYLHHGCPELTRPGVVHRYVSNLIL